jgi:succinate-semialdehyde dehydrogenase/glutarate-semialdehyde dehydrogenase
MPIESVNPTTGERIREYSEMTPVQVSEALGLAQEGFLRWRQQSFAARAVCMTGAAGLLRERAGEYARLMALEMGKPVTAGRSEIEKCAWVCDYYAANAEQFLRLESVETEATRSYVTFKPLGVVLAIMPWNFPFWQMFRFAAPALMAGNAVVLKHASNVPGCALAVERLMLDAGLPTGVFTTLLVGSGLVERIIEDPGVKAVTLTGSIAAGRAVARKAGEMLKKTVLELGGSDPYIVLESADLEQAASACAAARLANSGQTCIAAKRFVVVEGQLPRFEELIVDRMKRARVGDPLEEDTEVGPLARVDLRNQLHEQVERSVAQGARCLLGGEIPEGRGAFYPPTVLTVVGRGMPAYDDELFGPVAAIIPVKDGGDAIAVANDTKFGLGAAVFTGDAVQGEKIAADEIEAGCCFVNDSVRSDPRLPFGGVKESGYGRELSHYGIREFVNVKTVYVK